MAELAEAKHARVGVRPDTRLKLDRGAMRNYIGACLHSPAKGI